MPRQNRVTPFGTIVAHPGRGDLMGNRGRLHGPDGRIGHRRWTTWAWVTCRLSFKGRKRQLMAPRSYTELFFLDEAVALAAGHRPCGECRRRAHRAFRAAFATATGLADLPIRELDRAMQHARLRSGSRQQARHRRAVDDLPDGAFIALADDGGVERAWCVEGACLHRYTPDGYDRTVERPRHRIVEVLTPSVTVDVLAAGYRPAIRSATEGGRAPG